ncbi:MAG: hypothetical protein JWO38_1179 [Gemmataceae bacterium]|nr:hypothetical protein [Gemmataceae bacterium]
MLITALCPYCRAAGFRAPVSATGMSVTCPKCKSNFTIVPSNDLPGRAPPATASPLSARPTPAGPQAPPVEETRPHPVTADVTEPSPVVPPTRVPARSLAATTPIESPQFEPGFTTALVAVILFGLAMLATLFPYGRLIALGLAGVGLLTGLVCLAAEGRAQLVGAAAAVLHLVAAGVLLLAPSWLGLDPWRSSVPNDGPKGPHSVAHGTSEIGPTDRIDGDKAAWASGDVRVSVRSGGVNPIELTAPNGAKRQTRDAALRILVRVTNTGVERRVGLSDWAAGGKPDGPRLTDPAGKVLKPKTFDAGWEPSGLVKSDGLFPGQSAEISFWYEPPGPATPATPPGPAKGPRAARVEFLQLELPGGAVGSPDPIRFRLPGPF